MTAAQERRKSPEFPGPRDQVITKFEEILSSENYDSAVFLVDLEGVLLPNDSLVDVSRFWNREAVETRMKNLEPNKALTDLLRNWVELGGLISSASQLDWSFEPTTQEEAFKNRGRELLKGIAEDAENEDKGYRGIRTCFGKKPFFILLSDDFNKTPERLVNVLKSQHSKLNPETDFLTIFLTGFNKNSSSYETKLYQELLQAFSALLKA